ncbi:hypothetical protein [Pseudomonas aeruginosa]|uniref:hypothetical protein n=1 Tax=Pseudomonas aeruginosa TaxID=287 RepID=UPI000287092E|nr:hypothetical protein [Pseudomonas aeruginosa]AFS51555.1 TraQ DNA transfer protein [uncultured bacterium]RPV83067.1 hypothetical protein IPC780_29205 [Pseudomonas aeruginosa]
MSAAVIALSIALAVAVLTAGFFAYAYRLERDSHHTAREWARAESTGHLIFKTALESLYQTLERSNGGAGKRLAECRETAEAIFTHCPALFEQEPGLIHWLQATDRFLVELESKMPEDSIRAHVVNSRSDEIYSRVHRAIGSEAAPA